MNAELSSFLTQAIIDAAKALPAAVVAAVLVVRTNPVLKQTGIFSKVLAVVSSVFSGVLGGQVSREFEHSRPYSSLAVIVAAFLSQDLAMAAATRGRRIIRNTLNNADKEGKLP